MYSRPFDLLEVIVLGTAVALHLQPYSNCRLLANYQLSTSPITVGPWGLLQPFADGQN